MKIAVYAISKNEEAFVSRFCQSAKEADYVLIADTGSTDNTVSLAIQNNAVVHEISILPWRFDKARDAALALLPKDIDVCVSLDLDETLQPGWRQEIERVWSDKTTRMRYLYDWGSGIVFHSDKIHKRHGYHWHHPCHETLRADLRTKEEWATTDNLLIVHKPDNTKSRGQYLELLEMSVKEDPLCPRNAFYYARELTFYAQWETGIKALKTYLDNPQAVWVSERSAAMRLLGECYGHLGYTKDSIRWHRLACAECPTEVEPWVGLANEMYRQKDWTGCYTACLNAMGVGNYQKTYLSDPHAGGVKLYDLAAISSHYLGRNQEAVNYGEIALGFSPNDERLLKNLTLYKSFINN